MRVTKTVLTNMCMICNGDFILVQDKVNSSYTGVTFPGGHVEHGETLADAMIREVKEETGLTIKNPRLCGVYDWMAEADVRYLVFIYKTEEYEGELCASVEGNIRWILKGDFLQEKLAHGMDKVFEIAMNGEYTECFCNLENRNETLL